MTPQWKVCLGEPGWSFAIADDSVLDRLSQPSQSLLSSSVGVATHEWWGKILGNLCLFQWASGHTTHFFMVNICYFLAMKFDSSLNIGSFEEALPQHCMWTLVLISLKISLFEEQWLEQSFVAQETQGMKTCGTLACNSICFIMTSGPTSVIEGLCQFSSQNINCWAKQRCFPSRLYLCTMDARHSCLSTL